MINLNQTQKHFYGLDLLRGISGYGVAICHFFAFIYNNTFLEYLSFIFVEFFFVLSGFVLFPQLMRVLDNKNNLLIFYKRRWLRTLPLYFICLIMISLMFNKFLTLDFFKYLIFAQDLVPGFLEKNYFPIVWSLSIEEFFYLLFPLVLFFISKTNFATKIMYLFIFLVLIKFYFVSFFDSTFVRTGTFFRIDAIFLGFLLRYAYLKFNFYNSIILSLFFTLTYIFLQDFILDNSNEPLIKFGFVILLQLLSASVLIFFLKIEPIFQFTVIKKISTLVSKQTYAVYLTHMIFLYILIDLDFNILNKFLLYVALLFLTSTVSYTFIEKPILDVRPKFL